MDNILKNTPKFDKETNAKLQSIVRRAKERKPSDQNLIQTRKNRDTIQQLQQNLKQNDPEYSQKQDWLDTLDRYLKDQHHSAYVHKIEAATNTSIL